MGNYSLILVLSAILTGGGIVWGMQRTQMDSDSQANEQMYHVLAREAAVVGINNTVRNLTNAVVASAGASWMTINQTDVPYEGGTYSVEAIENQCTGLAASEIGKARNILAAHGSNDLIEVRSTGRYQTPNLQSAYGDDPIQEHQIVSCYIKSKSSMGTPPITEFVFLSNDDLTFNGGPTIQAYLDGDGNVHTNEDATIGPNVLIEGRLTYTDDSPSVHRNSTVTGGHAEGPTIQLAPFDPAVYEPVGQHDLKSYSNPYPGMTQVNGRAWLYQNPAPGSGLPGTKENPFVWYIDGDLVLGGSDHLVLPGFTIVVVTGKVDISGSANITTTGTLPPTKTNQMSTAEYEALVKAWIDTQVAEDGTGKVGIYSDGNVRINGGGSVVANFYTNGDFEMDGGGGGTNIVGSVTALGTITANGGGNGGNFWFRPMSDEVHIPGINLLRDVINLIAWSEWTDPVLDHTSSL